MNTLPKLQRPHPLSIQGRFGRLSFIAWFGLLHSFVGLIFIVFITILLSMGLSLELSQNQSIALFYQMASVIFLIGIACYFYLYIMIMARRLHDLNQSAWLILLCLVPLVNFIFILCLIFMKGTATKNHYGLPRLATLWEKIVAYLVIFLTIYLLFFDINLNTPNASEQQRLLQQLEQQTDFF